MLKGRQIQQCATSCTEHWLSEPQGRSHGLNGFCKGIAGAVENGRGLNIACFSGGRDQGGQLGELGWLVVGLHNEGLDLCGCAATENLPQLVAERSVWESAIGHAQQLSLAEWVDQSFKAYPQKLVNVRVENLERRKGWADCAPLYSLVQEAEAAMAEDGRVLVRASGTEPLLRVMVEAADQAVVDHWTARLAEAAELHLNAS